MIDAFKKGEYWSEQNKKDFEKSSLLRLAD